MNKIQKIVSRIIKTDIFCEVNDGDPTRYYVSDGIAAILEIHAGAEIVYPEDTPAIWNRKENCKLSADKELNTAADSLVYQSNKFEQTGRSESK